MEEGSKFYVPNMVFESKYKTAREARKAALAEARASYKEQSQYDPETRTYRGVHLDEWRELVDKSYVYVEGSSSHARDHSELAAKLEEVGGTSGGLTDALYQDWTPHFGYPEKINAREMSNTGFINLCGAVVKTIVDEIIAYEIAELTGGYSIRGAHVDMNLLKQIREEAVENLHRDHMQLFLLGMDPTAVIRACPKNARNYLDRTYGPVRRDLAREIQESGISMEELMEALELDREELARWLMWPFERRRKKIKKYIKERRENDEKGI